LGAIYRCAREAWPFLSFHFILFSGASSTDFSPHVFCGHINGPTNHFGQTNCRLLDGSWDPNSTTPQPFGTLLSRRNKRSSEKVTASIQWKKWRLTVTRAM